MAGISLRYTVFLVLLLFITACAGPTTQRVALDDAVVAQEAERQREYALREQINNQRRLHNVGLPILEAGLPLCIDRRTWGIGALFANQHDFPREMRNTAASVLGLGDDRLTVVIIAKGQPAETAGLQEGDVIRAINGEAAPTGNGAASKLTNILKSEARDRNTISMTVSRIGEIKDIDITLNERCDYPMFIADSDGINAYADGNAIYVTQGMMDFAARDDELALVIAHELAHNNMRHIDSKRWNAMGGFLVDLLFAGFGINTYGAFSNMAANAYSQEFEQEADYVGLYIMARAGMPIEDTPLFWRRLGARKPSSIDRDYMGTHPSSPERFVALEETIKEIHHKHEAGLDLMPNIEEDAIKKREAPPDRGPGFRPR